MTGQSDITAQVEALIEDFQRSDLRELHVRTAGFELYISNEAGAGIDTSVTTGTPPPPPAAAPTSAPPLAPALAPSPEAPDAAAPLPPGTVAVEAPYLGTFYRSPKPGSPAYVELGSRVTADSELCLVEVMKLFTAVRAGVAGTIEAILAADGQMVEAGQPLFAIRAD